MRIECVLGLYKDSCISIKAMISPGTTQAVINRLSRWFRINLYKLRIFEELREFFILYE